MRLDPGFGQRVQAVERQPEPHRAPGDLRQRFLAGDVQAGQASAPSAPRACSSSVDLPMPGSPPTSTTAPSTRPPPSTRSNSPMPVDTRASSLWRTSFSAVTFGASTLPAQPSRRAAGGLRRGRRLEHDLRSACSTPRIRRTGPATCCGRRRIRRRRRRCALCWRILASLSWRRSVECRHSTGVVRDARSQASETRRSGPCGSGASVDSRRRSVGVCRSPRAAAGPWRPGHRRRRDAAATCTTRCPAEVSLMPSASSTTRPLSTIRRRISLSPWIQLDALVDPVQHLEQREIFERNRIHEHLWPGAVRDELVPEIGIEPTTYALRMRRSTN